MIFIYTYITLLILESIKTCALWWPVCFMEMPSLSIETATISASKCSATKETFASWSEGRWVGHRVGRKWSANQTATQRSKTTYPMLSKKKTQKLLKRTNPEILRDLGYIFRNTSQTWIVLQSCYARISPDTTSTNSNCNLSPTWIFQWNQGDSRISPPFLGMSPLDQIYG